jgi:hypothetical protein
MSRKRRTLFDLPILYPKTYGELNVKTLEDDDDELSSLGSLNEFNMPEKILKPEEEYEEDESSLMSFVEERTNKPRKPNLDFLEQEDEDKSLSSLSGIYEKEPTQKRKWKGLSRYIKQSESPKSTNFDVIPFDRWKELPGVLKPIEIVDEEVYEDISKPSFRQENIMKIVNNISMKNLKLSTRKGKKGTQLPELKDYAKQLNVPITNQKKVVIAQRIYDKIKDTK